MSKQQIFVKHKDEIMIEILRLHRLKFCDDEHRPKIEAEAVNHGKVQGLMWALGLFDIKNNKDTDPFDQWNDLNDENEFSNVLPDEPKHEQDKRLYKEGK